MPNQLKGYRFSSRTLQMLEEMSEQTGMSQSAIVQAAIAAYYRSLCRKVRVRLVDGRVVDGRLTTDNAASSYGQPVVEVDGQAVDAWQIVGIDG